MILNVVNSPRSAYVFTLCEFSEFAFSCENSYAQTVRTFSPRASPGVASPRNRSFAFDRAIARRTASLRARWPRRRRWRRAVPPAPSAATALLSLLEEPRAALRAHALRALHDVVDREWSAVASSVAAIEALYEDETFEAREDAALLASKVRARGEKESAKRRRGWERDADLVARDEDRARPDDGLATARPR